MVDRKFTIRDIARLAGVSRSTVSLVINDDTRISEDTRQRVQSVIRRSGFAPNAMARGLARRRAGMIAVVVPRISSHVFSDYYFSEAISGIGDTLAGRGFRMLIEMATEQFIRDESHHKLFREGQIDGMLLVGTLITDEYILEIGRLHNVLLVNSRLENLPSVVADNCQGARAMVGHLVGLGHREIGYIGGLEITTVGRDRSAGFRDGMAAAGLEVAGHRVAWGNFSEESGHEVGRRLLTAPGRPTAIFAANDMMAIGCLRAAEELGLAVPRDLTVVGADDVGLASYVRPRLTTIRQAMYDIGRTATECLLAMPSRRPARGTAVMRGVAAAEADPAPPRASGRRTPPGPEAIAAAQQAAGAPQRVIPTQLVIRESSGPPPR